MKLYFYALGILIVVYFVHIFGMNGGYLAYPWLDVVSHFLVCFGMAMATAAVVLSLWPNMRYKAIFIVAITFAVGIVWEWIEVHYDITGHELWSTKYYLDTTKDFVVDLVGASFGAYVSLRGKRSGLQATIATDSVFIKADEEVA